ncbi:MAG: hypothetical protein E7037_08075 [Verrucomicrobia bacterium]|nr:hypothetical protein [Verrucomicrobiota bacterium]
MKKNNIPLLNLLSLGGAFLGAAVSLNAETVWAKGVNENAGWVDVNKNWQEDRQLCWAAAASNIIEWWQRSADAKQIPAGTPQGVENIFDAFRTAFADKGLGTNIAWKWYFGGCDLVRYNYERDFRNQKTAKTSGRYWEPYVAKVAGKTLSPETDPKWIPGGMICETRESARSAEKLAGTLKSLFERGYGVSLALVSGGNWPGGHAITLWGMEYEGDFIKTLYVTDSDDGVTKLQRYDVYYKEIEHLREEDKNGKIQEEAWSETRIYLQNYYGSNAYALSSYGALALPCPEPR